MQRVSQRDWTKASEQIRTVRLLVEVDHSQSSAGLLGKELDRGGLAHPRLTDQQQGFTMYQGSSCCFKQHSCVLGQREDRVKGRSAHRGGCKGEAYPANLETCLSLGEAGLVLGGEILCILLADVHCEGNLLSQFGSHFFDGNKPTEAVHRILKFINCVSMFLF